MKHLIIVRKPVQWRIFQDYYQRSAHCGRPVFVKNRALASVFTNIGALSRIARIEGLANSQRFSIEVK